MNKNLTILGSGIMGSAILKALLTKKVFRASDVTVADTDLKKLANVKKLGVKVTTDNRVAIRNADLILLAVKPQQLTLALADIKTNATIISILAGTKIRTLENLTGSRKIVRVMPNTPAQIGAGISGWIATKAVKEKALVKKILASFGEEIELKSEALLDAVTAISGSGPAYYFAFTEALIEAGEKLGLGSHAEKFARATFLGAARLAEVSGKDCTTLRENVTSKGGTTFAALKSFQKNDLKKLVKKATKAAWKRSQELSKG